MSIEYTENVKKLLLDLYLNIFINIHNTKKEYQELELYSIENYKKIREILKLIDEEDIKSIFVDRDVDRDGSD